jgi:GDPmannose 4,6-dehydratase
MSKILITGISGQDGSYLAEYMLELGHEVHGIIRRHSVAENQSARINHIRPRIHLYYGDMTDSTSLESALNKSSPDYIFHLAAQSFVRASFDIPEYTTMVNYNGTLKLFELCRKFCPEARIYNASSSEMFGLSTDEDGFQRETTPMIPVSPYGISKLSAYNLARHFRRAYGMHISSGILFNHCSPRRGASFVEQKIVKTAVEIEYGLTDRLELGNLDAKRDWGYAKDYARQMWKIVNQEKADDFVIATGIAYSIKEICGIVFGYLRMDYKNYLCVNQRHMRDEELPYLCGDATKAYKTFGWKPTHTLNDVLYEMIEYWLKTLKDGKR